MARPVMPLSRRGHRSYSAIVTPVVRVSTRPLPTACRLRTPGKTRDATSWKASARRIVSFLAFFVLFIVHHNEIMRRLAVDSDPAGLGFNSRSRIVCFYFLREI
jgi:hypothetical protein